MPETIQSVLLDEPREVDVVAIERELTHLWKQATPPEDEELSSPVIRACALNLIVVVGERSELGSLGATVGGVTVEHPSRTFLTLIDRERDRPSLEAWVSARCSLPSPGEKQVCCEEISLVATAGDIPKVPSIITSLLVPDVPTVLVWNSDVDLNDAVLRAFVELSDRVLIDSSAADHPTRILKSWSALAARAGSGTAFGDLAWTHLRQWRSLLAQTFQPPEVRSHLASLEGVTVSYSAGFTPVRSGLSQSLLLIGWLAKVLGWQRRRGVMEEGQGTYSGTAGARGGEIVLRVVPISPGNDRQGGIESVTLNSREGMTISLHSLYRGTCVRLRRSTTDGTGQETLLPVREHTEADILAFELGELHVSDQYVESVRALLGLLDER
jgi:glucose-6-phosphate dehydrogenase assembly protein OpcA